MPVGNSSFTPHVHAARRVPQLVHLCVCWNTLVSLMVNGEGDLTRFVYTQRAQN